MTSKFVSAIEAASLGLIKIGKSKFFQRVDQVIGACPVPAQLVFLIKTSHADALEWTLHQHFAARMSHREWFSIDFHELHECLSGMGLSEASETTDVREMVAGRCIVCGAEMFAGTPRRKYCSKACLQKAYRLNNPGSPKKRREDTYDRNGFAKQCLSCGRDYIAMRTHSKYCSAKCRRLKWGQQKAPQQMKRISSPKLVYWEI